MDIYCAMCGTKMEESSAVTTLIGYKVTNPKIYKCPGCKTEWAVDGRSEHLIMEEVTEFAAIGCC